jgi:hypothetical protein
MRITRWAVACAVLLSTSLETHAAGSLLRVACDGADQGAEISINGVFKGECPLDIQVNAGTVQLRLVKRIDALRERVFQQEFRMGDGVVKKVEAVLSAPQWNAEGLRLEREREAVRQAAAAEAYRADQELLAQQQRAAETGDTAAMVALAERHVSGAGVPKSDERATAWYRLAASAGNDLAKFKLSALYKQRRNDADVQAVVRMLALPSDARRDVVLEGKDAIRAFVANDPFFTPVGGAQKISYRYSKPVGTLRLYNAMTCERKGSLFATTSTTQVSDASTTTEGEMLLGGLIWLDAKASHGFLRSTTTELSRLEKLEGQPFPLTPGKRFGFTSTYSSSGTYAGNGKFTTKVTCAATDVAVKAAGNFKIPDGVQQVICYSENGILDEITRYYLHEGSACLVNVGQQ